MVFIAVLVLVMFADALTGYIPFSVEQQINLPTPGKEAEQGPLNEYLQQLADRIARAQDLPEEMTVTVHYIDDETVNAFATLGGNVFLFRGLLEKLPNENALAMLMAHEIAHIKHRHPIRSLGRGVIVGLALSIVSQAAGDALIQNFIGKAGYLTVLKYSRNMEREADDTAIKTLIRMYGHLGGAGDLFHVLQQEADALEPPVFFSTHPLTEDRIKEINTRSAAYSGPDTTRLMPLPAAYVEWVRKKDEPPMEECNNKTAVKIDGTQEQCGPE